MHNGFLNINNQKMSKSLGNFFTVRDIAEKYDLQVLRFFMLSAHYRSPLNFSADIMESSKNALERILTAVENLTHLSETAADGLTAEEEKALEEMKQYRSKFEEAMDDDLNTADAISAVFELVKFANTTAGSDSSKTFLETVKKEIQELCDILGILTEKEKDDLEAEVEALIEERQAARKAKDFAKADEIRDKLLAMGIQLKDTREGVQWKRI
jgi:cysteinyl-tRNA synthetase